MVDYIAVGTATASRNLCALGSLPLTVSPKLSMTTRSPSQSPSKHITVVDVYDLAASIGKDFERIIDQFGNDAVRQLMPKVISALETLESLANHNERENEEIIGLRKSVDRLENEKHVKQQDRVKFEMELEAVEENYRKEIDDLWAMVKGLQTENKQLSCSVPAETHSPAAPRDEDLTVMIEMREMCNKQKEQIKELQKDIDTYSCEVDNLHNNIEKLIRQNEELLRKNGSLQKQGRMLVEEKTEIIKRLQHTEEANFKITKMFKDASRQCKDLQQSQQEDNDNSPRFTLAELREVLQEKNLLKGKVLELEEEIEQLRPSRRPGSTDSAANQESEYKPADSEEYVVYGPINKEPEEKLYPWKYERKDSGVRKFFRFFKEGLNSGGYSPGRGPSSPVPSTKTMSSLSSIAQSPR